MIKLKMHSRNKVDENIEKIGKLFPNCLTERIVGYEKDRDEKKILEKPIIEYAIDFEMLRQELSPVVEGNEERYQFTWPDKKRFVLLANAPIAKNLDCNGRFHTDWLNMIYPRLKLAKDLLSDDGVIFVQIDDNEVKTLGKVLNEVFGEDNFINIVTVKIKIGGVSGSSEGKSWKYTSVMTKLDDKVLIKEDKSRKMRLLGYKTLETMSIIAFANGKGMSKEAAYDGYADRIFQTTNAQSSVRGTVMKETDGYDYPMIGCEYAPIKGRNVGQTYSCHKRILQGLHPEKLYMFRNNSEEFIY